MCQGTVVQKLKKSFRRARKRVPINVRCVEIPNNKTFAIESTNIRHCCYHSLVLSLAGLGAMVNCKDRAADIVKRDFAK